MIILFPSYPFEKKRIDPGFEVEERAAREAGFQTAFVDRELGMGSMEFHKLPNEAATFLYRGWLLPPARYLALEVALLSLGFSVHTTTANYLEAHDFPKWYEKLEGQTPKSIYFEGEASSFNLPVISHLVEQEFGEQALIVKDWLKSRKHEWYDACFIGDASASGEVQRVVGNFIKGQADDFAGGLVFREFVEFERAGTHMKSRMPLVKEWRVFVWEGKPFYTAPYWSLDVMFGDQYGSAIPLDDPWLLEVAGKIASPFFVLDVAKRLDGTKMVVEANDAGTAGIPEGGSPEGFYAALRGMI
jgi:hypothetical protein